MTPPPVPARSPDDLITLYEAAERLGVHYMTAYRYVRTGRLPGHKVGAEWRVEPADLERFAVDQAAALVPPTADATTRRRRVDYHRRLVERLIAGDEHGSWAIVQSALAAGHDPAEVYLDVLAPALTAIGDGWAAGELTVAEEHQASVVVHRLIGRLGPMFTRCGRTRGSIVLGAPAGDPHSLPSALFADLLRGVGFTAIDLGADTPTASFVDTAAGAERLIAVAISATAPDDDDAIVELTGRLRHSVAAPIVLGGGAITSAAHALALGADRWAPTTRDGIELFTELADEGARERRRSTRREKP